MRWNSIDLKILVEESGKKSTSEISIMVNRSVDAVKLKINRLGLTSKYERYEIVECLQCGKTFEAAKKESRKYCSHSCSAKETNRKRCKYPKKCAFCDKSFKGSSNETKFCSFKCMGKWNSKEAYIKTTTQEGSKESKESKESKSVKPFILAEQDYKCALCPVTNTWNGKPLVFVLDHIDGNANNNKRNNLRLVCPNCDSQLPTFKSRNKGSGRYYRKQRMIEGKSY